MSARAINENKLRKKIEALEAAYKRFCEANDAPSTVAASLVSTELRALKTILECLD